MLKMHENEIDSLNLHITELKLNINDYKDEITKMKE